MSLLQNSVSFARGYAISRPVGCEGFFPVGFVNQDFLIDAFYIIPDCFLLRLFGLVV